MFDHEPCLTGKICKTHATSNFVYVTCVAQKFFMSSGVVSAKGAMSCVCVCVCVCVRVCVCVPVRSLAFNSIRNTLSLPLSLSLCDGQPLATRASIRLEQRADTRTLRAVKSRHTCVGETSSGEALHLRRRRKDGREEGR